MRAIGMGTFLSTCGLLVVLLPKEPSHREEDFIGGRRDDINNYCTSSDCRPVWRFRVG
jgi:hypothetical protein